MKKTGRGLAAFILMAVAIVFVLAASSVDSTDPSYSHTITYIDPTGTNESYTATYDGIAATEYNPMYWKGTGEVESTTNNWAAPGYDKLAEFKSINNEPSITTTGTRENWTGSVTIDSNGVIQEPMGESTDHVVTATSVQTEVTFTYDGSSGDPGKNRDYYFLIPKTYTFTYSTTPSVTIDHSSYDTKYERYHFNSGNNNSVKVTLTFTNISITPDKVFGGWMAWDKQDKKWFLVNPGDVVSNDITKLYAKWIEPDVFILKSDTVYYNRWVTLGTEYEVKPLSPSASLTNVTGSWSLRTIDVKNGAESAKGGYSGITFGNQRTDYDMYGTIYSLKYEKTRNLYGYFNTDLGSSPVKSLPTGTYRSTDLSHIVSLNIGNCTLSGNVIIDNVGLMAKDGSGGTHGDGVKSTIFANGHMLIIGTGITNPKIGTGTCLVDITKSRDPNIAVPQVFGGKQNSALNQAIDIGNGNAKKKIVFADGRETAVGATPLAVDLGTYVIIHEGIYYNLIAGSFQGNIGTAETPLSTYMVLKGGEVADTLAGGNSGANGGKNIIGCSPEDASAKKENVGGTFVYVTGNFYMPGDDWQDKQTGFEDRTTTSYTIVQSTILEGGHSRGKDVQAVITGSSHVFLSGKSSVWDVQAGGRAGTTHTDTAYLEISGSATVRHIACGTITDGIPNDANSNNTVNDVVINITDKATVASVFGGGYDTYEVPNGRSMLWDSSISITIDGGKIGYVFGGGLRGTIGKEVTPADAPYHKNLAISIDIKGGNIVYDVFGGGSGGLDKMKHYVDGTPASDLSKPGMKNTVGYSNVYGDVDISISGNATIDGNVYGGGMSLPLLKSYSWGTQTKTDFSSGDYDVACVYGNVSITVDGGTVKGDVYGGGKGINVSFDGNTPTFYKDENRNEGSLLKPTILTLKKDGNTIGFMELPWFTGSDNQYAYEYLDKKNDLVMISAAHTGLYYKPIVSNTDVLFEKINDPEDTKKIVFTDSNENVYVQGIDDDGFFIEHNSKKYRPTNNGRFTDGTVTISVTITSGSSFYWGIKDNSISPGKFKIEKIGAIQGKYLDRYAKVTGDTIVKINAGSIEGSVYGAGSIGKLDGSTIVDVSGGTIGENVFGGGMGVVGNEGVTGNRGVYISGQATAIHGSVYGGSSNGDDGSYDKYWSGDPTRLSNSTIVIDQGTITGSVFGGGFMGNTWGNTAIYVGHHYNAEQKYSHDKDSTDDREEKTISISSIYAGGNIRIGDNDNTEAFKETVVWGTGHIEICGDEGYRTILISGSIMGSGNSCNTYGKTDIIMEKFESIQKLDAIHRATELTLIQSSAKIGGRSTTTGKTASIFKIEKFTLQFNSSVTVDNEIYDVLEFNSLNRDKNPTTAGSPSNMIEFTSGTTFSIGVGSSSSESQSNITGYTIMSVSNQNSYGAYVIGPKLSTGGFVVSREGSYKMAETSVSTDNRFWFISGTEMKIATMYLHGAYTADSESRPTDATNVNIEGTIDRNLKITDQTNIQIFKLMGGSKIKYVGGQFTPVSASSTSGKDYTFVKPGMDGTNYPDDNELGIIFGMDGTKTQESNGVLTTTNAVNLTLPKAATGSDSFYFNGPGGSGGADVNCYYLGSSNPSMTLNGATNEPAGIYDLKLQIIGAPNNVTAYPGYITLNFQEVKTSGNVELIVNTIELRIDVYIIADASVGSDNQYNIKMRTEQKSSNNNSGYSEIIFPASPEFVKGKMYLEQVTTEGINEGAVISVKPVMNHDSTTGWMNVNENVSVVVGSNANSTSFETSNSLHIYVGTMIGTDPTTIRYEIENFQYGLSDNPTFVLHLVTVKTDGNTVNSRITVNLVEAPLVKVKFIDQRVSNTLEITKTFPYGTILTPEMCPDTAENFAGWFTDNNKTQPYNYSTPLTDTENPIVLYSAYLVKVTFDNMRGTTYELYLPQTSSGSLIPVELVPKVNTENDGYEKVKWYTEKEYDYEWDFNSDKVNSNLTLYAKWVGVEVLLEFYENEDDTTPSYIIIDGKQLNIRVDTKIDITIDGKSVLERAKEVLFDTDNPMFISWYSKNDANSKTFSIGSSSILKTEMVKFGTPNTIKIYASTQNIAIQVDMEKNANDASISIANSIVTVFPGGQTQDPEHDYREDKYRTYAIRDKNLFTEKSESTEEEGDHTHYVDKFGNEWHKNDNTGKYRLTISGKSEGKYKDVYGNLYTGPDWSFETEYTDTQILVEAQYTCVYGAEYYYPFTYTLSDATRTGYKLIGWNNESIIGKDVSLTPRAGTERTVRLFVVFDNDNRPIVLREVIQLEGNDTSSQIETRSWTEQQNIRIDNPDSDGEYIIKYLARWQLLTYNVTVSDLTHGIIDAIVTKNDGSGNSQRIRIDGSYEATYGDRIVLNYTSKDNYKFNGWNAYGEFEIEDSSSISTTLIVKGVCSISVREIGDRPVIINILFDDNEKREDHIIVNENELRKTYVYLKNTVTNTYYELERVVDGTGLPYGKTQQYRGYVPVSDDPYAVCVRYKWSAEETELYFNAEVQGPVKTINVIPTVYIDEDYSTNLKKYNRVDLENGAYYLVCNGVRYYPSEDGTNTFLYNDNSTLRSITLIPSEYRDLNDNVYTRDANNTITGPGPVSYYLQNNVDDTYYKDNLQLISDNIYEYRGSNTTASIKVTPSKYVDSNGTLYDRVLDTNGKFYLTHGDSKYYPDGAKANYFNKTEGSGSGHITAYPSVFVDSRGIEYTRDVDDNGAQFIEDFNGNKYYTGVFEDYTMVGYVDVEMDNELSFTYYIISAYVHDYFASSGERIVDDRAFYISHPDIEKGGVVYTYVSENVYKNGNDIVYVTPASYTDGTTEYIAGSDEKGVYMTGKNTQTPKYYLVISDIFSSEDKTISVTPYTYTGETGTYTVKNDSFTIKYNHSNEEMVKNSIKYSRYVGALDSVINAKPDDEKKNKDTSGLPAVKATIKTGYTSNHLLEGFFDNTNFFQISPINEWKEPLVGPTDKEFNLNWTAVSKPAEIYVIIKVETYDVTYVVTGTEMTVTKSLSFGDDLIYSLAELFGPDYAAGKTAMGYAFYDGSIVRAIDILDETTVEKIGPGKPIRVEVTTKSTLPVFIDYLGQTLDGKYVTENRVRLPMLVSDNNPNVYTGEYRPIKIDGYTLDNDVKNGFIVRIDPDDILVFDFVEKTDNGDKYKHDSDTVIVNRTDINTFEDEDGNVYIGFIEGSKWTEEGLLNIVVTLPPNWQIDIMSNFSIKVLASRNIVTLQVAEEYQQYIIGDSWGGSYKIGETVQLPGMQQKDHHNLESWTSDGADGQIIEKNGLLYYLIGDNDSGTVTFTPVYEQDIYTVTVLTTVDTLVKNGEDLGQRYTEEIAEGNDFILPDLKNYVIMAPGVDLEAYSFNGYFTDDAGNKHYPGEPVKITKNTTLIASWTTTRFVLMYGFDGDYLSASISSSDLPSDSASKTGVWLELLGYDEGDPHLEGDGYKYYPVDRSNLHAGYMESPETDPLKRTIKIEQFTFKDVEYTIGYNGILEYIERAGIKYNKIGDNTYREEGGTKEVTVTPSKYKDALGNIYNAGKIGDVEYIERAGIKYYKIGDNTYREEGGKTVTVSPYKYDDTIIVTYTIGTDEKGAYMERTTDGERFYIVSGIFKNGNREVSIVAEDGRYYDSRHVEYTPGVDIGQACIFSPEGMPYYPVKVSYMSEAGEPIVVNPYQFLEVGATEPKYIWIDMDGPHYLRNIDTGDTYYQSADAATHMRSDTGVIKYECKSVFENPSTHQITTTYVVGLYYHSQVTLTISPISGNELDIDNSKATSLEDSTKVVDIGKPVKQSNGNYTWNFFMIDNMNLDLEPEVESATVTFLVNGQMLTTDDIEKISLEYKVNGDYVAASGFKFPLYTEIRFKAYDAYDWFTSSSLSEDSRITPVDGWYVLTAKENVSLYTSSDTFVINYYSHQGKVVYTTGSFTPEFDEGIAIVNIHDLREVMKKELESLGLDYYYRFIGWAIELDDGSVDIRYGPVSSYPIVITKNKTPSTLNLYPFYLTTGNAEFIYTGDYLNSSIENATTDPELEEAVFNQKEPSMVVYYYIGDKELYTLDEFKEYGSIYATSAAFIEIGEHRVQYFVDIGGGNGFRDTYIIKIMERTETTVNFYDGDEKIETKTYQGDVKLGELPYAGEEGFIGWFLADGTTEITSETNALDLDPETNAYARWETTVIHFINGETIVENRTLYGNEEVGKLPDAGERIGYEFLGWFLADGTTEITAETKALDLNRENNVYTKWEKLEVTVVDFINDDKLVEERTLYGDTVVGDLPDIGEKEGYILIGWFLADGKTEITADTKTSSLERNNTAYAVWEVDPARKTTVIHFHNGEETETRTYTGDVALGELPDAGKREGYTFIGWFLESGLELTPTTRTITLEDENDAYSLWQKNSEPVGPTDPTERSWEKRENPDGSVTTIITEKTVRPDGSVREKRTETTTYDDKTTRVVTESFTDAEGNTTVKVDEKITYHDGYLQRVIEIEGQDGEFVVKVPVIDPLNIYDAKEELDKLSYDSVVFEMDYLSSDFRVPEVSMPILADNDYGIRFINIDFTVTLDERTTKTLRNTGGDVTLTIHKAHPEDLTDDQEKLIGDKYAVTIILKAGDQTVSQLGGTATVSVFYKGSFVYYVDDNGHAEEIPCEYNMFTGDTTFTVGHFSIYLISKEKIPEPVPEPVKEMSILVYLAIAVLIATVIAVSVIMIRRR